jgi:hypothetical protein
VVGFAVSVLAGAGFVGLRALGEETKGTFDTLNEALAESAPGDEKATAGDVEAWIERYRTEARRISCASRSAEWDYVCTFEDRQKRTLKMGVMVDSRQPMQMSPIVKARKRLPPPTPA